MKIGRKGTILLGCLLICIGALLQAATYSVGQIIAGRIICGCGIGCIASAVPTYMVKLLASENPGVDTLLTTSYIGRPKCLSKPQNGDLKYHTSLRSSSPVLPWRTGLTSVLCKALTRVLTSGASL